MNDLNLDHIAQEVVVEIKKAGQLILALYKAGLTFTSKSDGSLVSNADLACQTYLMQQLERLIPNASFYAEEGDQNQDVMSEQWCWIIDPVDGTTNFIRGIPHFCLSIALTYQQDLMLGVIYDPSVDECYVAIKGKGSALNGKKIMVNNASVQNALLTISIGHKALQTYIATHVTSLMKTFFSLRLLGSAALDLAYVASGRADIVLHENLAWWDVAAGILLITEAGGIVTSYQGEPITPNFGSMIAASVQLHKEFIPILKATM